MRKILHQEDCCRHIFHSRPLHESHGSQILWWVCQVLPRAHTRHFHCDRRQGKALPFSDWATYFTRFWHSVSSFPLVASLLSLPSQQVFSLHLTQLLALPSLPSQQVFSLPLSPFSYKHFSKFRVRETDVGCEKVSVGIVHCVSFETKFKKRISNCLWTCGLGLKIK